MSAVMLLVQPDPPYGGPRSSGGGTPSCRWGSTIEPWDSHGPPFGGRGSPIGTMTVIPWLEHLPPSGRRPSCPCILVLPQSGEHRHGIGGSSSCRCMTLLLRGMNVVMPSHDRRPPIAWRGSPGSKPACTRSKKRHAPRRGPSSSGARTVTRRSSPGRHSRRSRGSFRSRAPGKSLQNGMVPR